MARYVQNIDDKIVGFDGQVFQIETRTDDLIDNKFFAVVAMCGHAGKGFFVPIIFPVAAKDKQNAIDIVKASPRVKNRSPRCILGICEISLSEFDFIKSLNNHDGYLTDTLPPIETRKVLMHHYAEVMMKQERGEKLTSKEKIMLSNVSSKNILFANDYPENYVLQKTFAPSLLSDKIVYPSKVNMDKLLYEYYKNKIQNLGIKNKKAYVLSFCLMIFGLENQFGVRLDTTNNIISFTSKNGEVGSIQITEKSKESIVSRQDYRLRNAIKKFQQTSEQISPEIDIKLPSAIDKFNARWGKTTQATKDKEKAD